MRLTNELRTVEVSSRPGRIVEAVVRRRGVDARVAGRGLVLQTEEPITLLVREPDTLRRVAMPERRSQPAAFAWVAAPVAAAVIARILGPKRSK